MYAKTTMTNILAVHDPSTFVIGGVAGHVVSSVLSQMFVRYLLLNCLNLILIFSYVTLGHISFCTQPLYILALTNVGLLLTFW